MRKLLLLFFVLCNLKNGFANATNDSIYVYLERNLRYPSLCRENYLIGNVIVEINKNDTSLSYEIYKQDKWKIFTNEVLRVIKAKEFRQLLPNRGNLILNINYNIQSVLPDLLSSSDSLLIDSVKLEKLQKVVSTINYNFNLGEKEKIESDSILNLYYTNSEQIWQNNTSNYKVNPKDFITQKKIDSSFLIIRYQTLAMYSLCKVKKKLKACKIFNEISISKNGIIEIKKYQIIENKLELQNKIIKNYNTDSLLVSLNKLRCFPNQSKHINGISCGWSCKMEIYYDNKYRVYYYSNPDYYAKEGYMLEKEFMVLFTYLNSFFK